VETGAALLALLFVTIGVLCLVAWLMYNDRR
jgi:hypothetical protein